jgi:hypothetical protein
MTRLTAYIRCYAIGWRVAHEQAALLTQSKSARVKNAVKGANLTLCFMGFIPKGRTDLFVPCAEIGALAATFDLLSDGLGFSPEARSEFDAYCHRLLSEETRSRLTELLEAKRRGLLGDAGLERGIYAVEIICNHLAVRDYWANAIDINDFGLMCQVADDILDYRQDAGSDHLNFLKSPDALQWLDKYVAWNDTTFMAASAYPGLLKRVFDFTHRRARRLRSSLNASTMSQTPSMANSKPSGN